MRKGRSADKLKVLIQPKHSESQLKQISPPKTKKSAQLKQSAVQQRVSRSQTKIAGQKSLQSLSQDKNSKDDVQNVDKSEIVYQVDNLVAFVDKEDVENGVQQISIGKILSDTTQTPNQIIITQFNPQPKQKQVVDFTLVSKQVAIKDYQVICRIASEKETKTKVTISKKTSNEVTLLLNRLYDSIRDQINLEIDAEAENASNQEDNKMEVVKVRVQRKLIKGKRSLTKTQVNKSANKKPEQLSNKASDSDDSESNNSDDEIINQIGKKRPFKATNKARSLSEQSTKMKKIDEGVSQLIQTAKPIAAEKVKVFKLGKWNPDTILLNPNQEIERSDQKDTLINNCCIRCNNRNVVRAVKTNNIKLLRAAINAKDQIANVCARWSQDTPNINPLELIIKKQNLEFFETFFKIPVKNKADQSEYQNAAEQFFVSDRVKVRESLLTRIDTGFVSHKAYGRAIRSVQMTRGNRQGNQAFVISQDEIQNPLDIADQDFFKAYITPAMYQSWCVLTRQETELTYDLQKYALAGNVEILKWAIQPMVKQENYGYNQLHLDVLKLDKLTQKYHTASITKKAAQSGITPLHLACLNPSKAVLATLLQQNNDINVADYQINKPIHFAAISSAPEPLQLLIDKGANVFDMNNEKQTPLHFAAINSRALNVKAILENNLLTLKYRDKKNKTAFAYACEKGDIETIKAFLDFSDSKIKVNTGQGVDRMTPLMYAAAQGNFELAQFLLGRNARVLAKDKFKRTALIMACRNGHVRVASLLLQHGSDWNHIDSSNNTALHYAAANGFIECIDLLIKHQADVNAMNSWNVTPITIAMLNNHLGTVKRLLQEDKVDVNGKDDKGRTLLSMAMLNLEDQDSVEFTKYLLSKGADVNLGDVEMITPLHILAGFIPQPDSSKEGKAKLASLKAVQKKLSDLINLLLSHGANLQSKSKDGLTPFVVALDNGNINVLHQLSSKVQLNENPEILHKFKSRLFDERFRSILIQLLNQEVYLKSETVNYLDDQGFSPFLLYINEYVKSVKSGTFRSLIRTVLKWNAFKHKHNYDKYQVTNQLIFDQSEITNDEKYQNMLNLAKISADREEVLVKQYTFEFITKPFIEFLRTLVSQGADPHQKVGKTKFYRELDEHKRQLQLINESREAVLAVQTEIQINTAVIQDKGEVKTRKEVLAEKKFESRIGQKKNKDKTENKVSKALREFYAKKGHEAKFMKRDGKNIEIEYNKEFGQQNAIHLLLRHPSVAIFDFLTDELNLAVDEIDFMGRNPFIINVISYPARQTFGKTITKLLNKNIRFDLADSNNRSPFLIYYENQNFTLANQLLDRGANVNQMDLGGLFALKYALIRRQDDEINRLVSRGADINQIDNKGRNLLHHAVNMSSSTADATFESEQTLIDLGINVNLRDNKGRVPLHYAFVKIQDWKSNSPIDPIETVSSLCGQPGLEIEVADKWQKTPLHYAAQRSATICTLYILQRGANIESLDIYSNSALGTSLLNQHYNYAILLIQKNANVSLPVYKEFPKRIAKLWTDAEKELKKQLRLTQNDQGGSDVEMESSLDNEEARQTGRNLFKCKVSKYNFQGYSFSDDSVNSDVEEQSDDEEQEDEHEQNVFNQQNAFGQQFFNKKATKKRHIGDESDNGDDDTKVEKEEPPMSTFKIAIQAQQQGLAYLILDNKFDYMLAMQVALDEKKFNLVLTLLSKTADNSVVQRRNEFNQNLMHILAKNSSGGAFHILKRIYDQLKKRGVNCFEKDSFGNNALSYAVQSNCYDLCEILINEGININEVNNEGQSPLSLYLRGKRGASLPLKSLKSIKYEDKNLFYLLAKNGADVNFRYPENSFGEDDYKCTVMINMIRHGSLINDQLRQNILCLQEFSASLQVTDSKNQDVMMHAIMQNNEQLVQFFVNHSSINKNGLFFRSNRDLLGKNAIHYVVNPHEFGSFENDKILNILINSSIGYELQVADNFGLTPLDYANLQSSGKLASLLSKRIGVNTKLNKGSKQQVAYLPANQWPEIKNDFNKDSQQLLAEAQQKKLQDLDQEKQDSQVPIDVAFDQEVQYKVWYEGKGPNRRPFDAYMTKVDLKNGLQYNFYKMQMVFDSNRNLYIVLTRYGRIGEQGMNQRTPFNSFDEAKQEFASIFKQKTANEWDNALDNFVEQPKKYVLVNLDYSNVEHEDYLAPFDYDNCAKTKLDKPLRLLIEEISNVTMYQRSLFKLGIDQQQMPISNLKKETVQKAQQILIDIRKSLTDIKNLRSKQFEDKVKLNTEECFEALRQEYIKVSDLTSLFYRLVPMNETKYWTVSPIRNHRELEQLQQKVDLLTNIEFSSRMLLGALYKQKILHPCDYVIENLQTQFRQMHVNEPEHKLISLFINSTSGKSKELKFSLFKVERRGEGERFEKYSHLDNRRLLFHGTKLTNMLGILGQGLRIAPPEAPPTGYMFGKGLYFADLFSKSANYCGYGPKSKLMLLCEVALGQTIDLFVSHNVDKLPKGYNSTRALGENGANYEKTIITPEGFQVPIGGLVKQKAPTKKEFQASIKLNKIENEDWDYYYDQDEKKFEWPLQNNEYIVYDAAQVKIRYVVQWGSNDQ